MNRFTKAGWLGLANPLPKWIAFGLAILPFVLMINAYYIGSEIRLEENPSDKLMPSFTKMWDSFYLYAFEESKRSGEYLLLNDWLASIQRLGIGLGLAALSALTIGVSVGLFPYVRKLFLPFITFTSIVPPLAILPILFITFGVDEVGKIALIFLGSVWFITRDVYDYVIALPKEQLVKSLTFNSSIFNLLRIVILPQVIPRLVDAMRLSLGAAWLFLIAAEAIAATEGLGYRIFLVRRYLAMDIIIPYVAIITATGFTFDMLLKSFVKWKYPWYVAQNRK